MQMIILKYEGKPFPFACYLFIDQLLVTMGVFSSRENAATWGKNVGNVLDAYRPEELTDDLLDEVVGKGFPDDHELQQRT